MEELVKDMTPRLIEDLGVLRRGNNKGAYRYGLYECQYCGNQWEVITTRVNNGQSKSCGCQKGSKPKHGLKSNRFYDTWYGMRGRCTNPKDRGYKNYGGRGITVCEEWLDVVNFVAWAEKTHPNIEGLSLDRIDNDKGYSPENCTWSDKTTQAINQRMKSNNTSGQNGIRFYLPTNKWVARITVNKVLKHIGYYETLEEAVLTRDQYIIDNKLPHKLSRDYKIGES